MRRKDFFGSGTVSELNEGLRAYILRVYNYMCSGLALSAIAAFATINVHPIRDLLFVVDGFGVLRTTTTLGMVVTFAPVAIALYFFFAQQRMSLEAAKYLFWVYSALTGMSLASIGFLYTAESVIVTLFVCAALFLVMSIYGHVTGSDLTSMGSFLMMALWGIIIAGLANMFLKSAALGFAASVIGVFVFTGLIAYDTQKIKSYYWAYERAGPQEAGKVAVLGAFMLYLDVINLFLHLLRFFGVSRRSE